MGQSLGLGLDQRASAPMYQQIFDQVAARIRSGAFPAGFRLPPSRALAEALGTNRNTVVRAYEDLEAAGFLESTVGRGTFVAGQPLLARGAPRSGAGTGNQSASNGDLPWNTLMARPAFAESLSRVERLQRSVGPMSIDAINLSRLDPAADLIPDELLRRCTDHVLRTQGAKVLRYGSREGLPRLRALIAEDLARKDVPATADDILVTSGSQQALDLLVRTLLNPGEPFLCDEWTFMGQLNLLSAAGARVVGVPSDEEGPSLSALERMAHLHPKGLYLMPNSQNPTGASISPARREALVAWSRRAGVPLIEDDYVADLDLDGTQPAAPLRALDRDVIYVGSFSKRLAPALRVGFLVLPPALRAKALLLRAAMDSGNSDLLQHVVAEFLERGYLAAHLRKSLPEYRRRRDALETGLRRHLPKEMGFRRPAQGLSLWVPLPTELRPEQVFEAAQKKGVLVHPSSLNAIDERTNGGGGIRLAFCSEPEPRLLEGARRFGRAIAGLGGRENATDQESIPTLGGI